MTQYLKPKFAFVFFCLFSVQALHSKLAVCSNTKHHATIDLKLLLVPLSIFPSPVHYQEDPLLCSSHVSCMEPHSQAQHCCQQSCSLPPEALHCCHDGEQKQYKMKSKSTGLRALSEAADELKEQESRFRSLILPKWTQGNLRKWLLSPQNCYSNSSFSWGNVANQSWAHVCHLMISSGFLLWNFSSGSGQKKQFRCQYQENDLLWLDKMQSLPLLKVF